MWRNVITASYSTNLGLAKLQIMLAFSPTWSTISVFICWCLRKWELLLMVSAQNYIFDALRDLVPFVQYKKHEKHPWRSFRLKVQKILRYWSVFLVTLQGTSSTKNELHKNVYFVILRILQNSSHSCFCKHYIFKKVLFQYVKIDFLKIQSKC